MPTADIPDTSLASCCATPTDLRWLAYWAATRHAAGLTPLEVADEISAHWVAAEVALAIEDAQA